MANCACGSEQDYSGCCEPFLSGKEKPPTAEALMRSRYTAYTMVAMDYIYETLHPKAKKQHDAEQSKEWASESEWLGLEVVRTEKGGPKDKTGIVEFVAKYKSKGEETEHREIAEFERHAGSWTFVDGKLVGPPPVRRDEPKVGRNDPCPCGSGKKYKKCCGKL